MSNMCEHCGGDGLLRLFSSIGPEPCPKCRGSVQVSKEVAGWISLVNIRPGEAGYFLMEPNLNKCCGDASPKSPATYYVCTRTKGHAGYHAGHTSLKIQVGVWQ